MAHGTDKGNHSERRSYKYRDQEHYSSSDIRAAAATGRVNASAYLNRDQAVNRIRDQEDQRRVNERLKHESGYAAVMHGNKPSRGAAIDTEIQIEEAKMLRKMNHEDLNLDTKKKPGPEQISKHKIESKLDLNVQPKADVIELSKGGSRGRW